MANFNITKNTSIPVSGVEKSDLRETIVENIEAYYNPHNIKVKNNDVIIKGNLKATFERAITKANINIIERNGKITLKAKGSTSIGMWAWVWLLLSFTGILGFFIFWFLADVIMFLINKDKPKQYLKEAFENVVSEYECVEYNVNHTSTQNGTKTDRLKINSTSTVKNTAKKENYIENLEKLANLKEKGVISEEEFQNQKNNILKNEGEL